MMNFSLKEEIGKYLANSISYYCKQDLVQCYHHKTLASKL